MSKTSRKKYRTIGSDRVAKTIRNFVEGNIRKGEKLVRTPRK